MDKMTFEDAVVQAAEDLAKGGSNLFAEAAIAGMMFMCKPGIDDELKERLEAVIDSVRQAE